MQKVNIRYALPGDANTIADLSRETFYESFSAQNTKENMDLFLSRQFSREKLAGELNIPGSLFFLAFLDDELAGYAKIRDEQPEEGDQFRDSIEIARIYARQKFVGRGVGSALMKACLDEATKRKKKMIWLGVWEYNKRAIDFYTGWGFEKFGEHPFLLGKDVQNDWLMRKIL